MSWENASCFANPIWLFNSSSDTIIFHVYCTKQGLQKDSADSIFPSGSLLCLPKFACFICSIFTEDKGEEWIGKQG